MSERITMENPPERIAAAQAHARKDTPGGFINSGAYCDFLAGWDGNQRRFQIIAARVMKELDHVWPKHRECAHARSEPDTCMTHMRCDACGMPLHLIDLLRAAQGRP